ncbi:hypothetical protein LIER_42883 [Lithospermum erythrorhizon]|uniref:Uncharacterized protein n=1 Tax=Lithospermum erythrorhizon TaxID=34254 RepID=A0AAV3P3S0_LITER
MRRVAELGPGPQASHEVSQLWLQAASTSVVLVDNNTGLHKQTLNLGEKLSQERLKPEALEQVLRDLHLQATNTNNLPWELALLARDRKRAAERDDAIQAARSAKREREDLRRAYCQDSPLRFRRASAAVLSDLVLHYQDQIPSLPALGRSIGSSSGQAGSIIRPPFLLFPGFFRSPRRVLFLLFSFL